MATIINNPPATPPSSERSGGFVGIIVGVVILLIAGFFFFAYGLPALRGTQGSDSKSGSPTINVPDTVDVNIKR